ncbi:hypothetical protein VBQ95_24540, partial [Klebsiella pneumoniae]|nr:hypothetical protein [Klebsiella pneumoniae]
LFQDVKLFISSFDINNEDFYDEFGNISLAAPWALKGMAEEIRIMKGFNFKLSNNVIISETNRCIDDCMVIKTSDAMRRSTINY